MKLTGELPYTRFYRYMKSGRWPLRGPEQGLQTFLYSNFQEWIFFKLSTEKVLILGWQPEAVWQDVQRS